MLAAPFFMDFLYFLSHPQPQSGSTFPRKQREKLSSLFATAGWPRPGDRASREAIAELLGLSKASLKATTYLAWATRRDATYLDRYSIEVLLRQLHYHLWPCHIPSSTVINPTYLLYLFSGKAWESIMQKQWGRVRSSKYLWTDVF